MTRNTYDILVSPSLAKAYLAVEFGGDWREKLVSTAWASRGRKLVACGNFWNSWVDSSNVRDIDWVRIPGNIHSLENPEIASKDDAWKFAKRVISVALQGQQGIPANKWAKTLADLDIMSVQVVKAVKS